MAGLLFLSQAHNAVFMLLAGACTGFAIGVIQSCGLAIAVKVTPKERIGRANSTFFVIMDLAVAIGPIVLGLFIPLMGYRGVYVAMAIGGMLCALLYYVLHGKNASASQKDQTPVK
jgi:predicted MFS family arabinose efflux permease